MTGVQASKLMRMMNSVMIRLPILNWGNYGRYRVDSSRVAGLVGATDYSPCAFDVLRSGLLGDVGTAMGPGGDAGDFRDIQLPTDQEQSKEVR